jgi:hypothetical protein
MAHHLIVTLPDDAALRQELEHEIADYAEILQARRSADQQAVEMVLEVADTGIGLEANVAAILTFLQVAKIQREAQDQPTAMSIRVEDGDPMPVEQADAEMLMHLLQAHAT